jgi:hypothetical protein
MRGGLRPLFRAGYNFYIKKPGYFAICVGGLVSGHARHPPDVVV